MLPFSPSTQLTPDLDQPAASRHLPGYPHIPLNDHASLQRFLHRDLLLSDLALLAHRLWMMSAHSHANISPLHRQKVKGREIIITEDPKLHLIWYYDRIFVKPLPRYLLSAGLWERYLSKDDELRRTALGYLRTYAFLIRYESDFRIAKRSDLCLIPEHVSWEQFCHFIAGPAQIQDREVAMRYEYGEIRLSRLNFYCKFLLGKQHFQRVHTQYGQYFATFYAPFLFVFGALSVLLSAMQVELATEALSEQLRAMWAVSRFFSVVTLGVIVLILIWMGYLFVYKFCKEWWHALGHRFARRH